MNEELTLEALLKELLYWYNLNSTLLDQLRSEGRTDSHHLVIQAKNQLDLLDSIFTHSRITVTTDLISGEKVIVKR